MNTIINILCFCIPLPSVRRRTRQRCKQWWRQKTNNLTTLTNTMSGRPIILWIDHALGGGTEVYSMRQFEKLGADFDVLRLQYMPATQQYHLTMAQNKHKMYQTRDIREICDFCCRQNIQQIVLNNLVAYKDAPQILQIIEQIKSKCVGRPLVSFRGHDYHAICPSFNLINCDGKYCNLSHGVGCEECWRNKILGNSAATHRVLKSGATSIEKWRLDWGQFLADTADEIILFSNATADIFLRTYPNIAHKIKIIPHTVPEYEQVNTKPHNGINIAVLGAMSHQKGADVIRAMASEINPTQNINIVVIGTMKNPPKNIRVYGAYRSRALPRIMRRNNIDIVFIPSIWPETFSYTTSEAMSMGMPIACYAMGAPAERVGPYNRGLVLNKIAPRENLNQIINFIKSGYKK